MNKGTFIFNGVSSDELKAKIEARPIIPSSQRKRSYTDINGVTGDYIFDYRSYSNVTFSIGCKSICSSESELRVMREKISYVFDTDTYKELKLYHDPEYIYHAIINVDFGEHNGIFKNELSFTLQVNCLPFKTLPETTLNSPSTINNPTMYDSLPIITLNGSGDMTVTVNGRPYNFKGVEGSIVCDSEIHNCYRKTDFKNVNENKKKVGYDFPILKHGDNTISVTGATSYTVIPNFRVKL